MVNILAPVAKAPTCVKVANFPGLYRHARSGRYYACKKLGGIRRERSLGTCDRKTAERRMKEWPGNLDKVDAEVEKTTLAPLLGCFDKSTKGASESSRVTDQRRGGQVRPRGLPTVHVAGRSLPDQTDQREGRSTGSERHDLVRVRYGLELAGT